MKKIMFVKHMHSVFRIYYGMNQVSMTTMFENKLSHKEHSLILLKKLSNKELSKLRREKDNH